MRATLNCLAILILLYCRVNIIHCTGEACENDCDQGNVSACPIIPWDQCRANGYQLNIIINNLTVRFMCLSESVSSYSVNVSLTSASSLHLKITRLPVSQFLGSKVTTNETDIMIPSDCWNTSDLALALEKCGPSAPLNLTVVITAVSESSVMMTVNWEPPPTYDTGINITAYKIVINNVTILITNQTEYQHNITIDAVRKYVIKVYASYGEVVDSTNYDITADNITLSWGQAAVVTKLLPSASTVPTVKTSATISSNSTSSTSSSSNKHGILLITLLSVNGSILLLVIVLVVVIITRHVRLHKANTYTPLSVINNPSS